MADAYVPDAPIDASLPADAAIDAAPPKIKRKATREQCFEECRRKNLSRHCADDDGNMMDCPCRCP